MLQELSTLNHTLGQINGVYHDVSVKMGISDSVMDILYGILCEGNGCNQSLLYKNSGLGKTTVNSAIRKMEKEGLLYLKPGDGRNTRVFLTDKGYELADRTAGRLMRMEEELFLSWTEQDRSLYLSLMQRYLEQFARKVQEEME